MDQHDQPIPPPPSNSPPSQSDSLPPLGSADMAGHLRTLYQLQSMLRRQLMQSGRSDSAGSGGNNGGSNGDHLSIHIDSPANPADQSDNQPHPRNSHNPSSNRNNNPLGAEASIATEELTNGTRFDLQLVTKWLEQAFPFIFLLLLVWIYEHRNGIAAFVWMTVVFLHSNQAVRKQVALKDKRSMWVLSGIALELTLHIFFIYFYFRKEELWRYLISLPPRRTLSIWVTFWVIIMNDFMVRFFTMVVKCFVIMAVGHVPPHKRNAQLYSVVESASNTYRTILPVSIWFKYMFNPNDVFSNLITLMYLLMKFNTMYEKVVQFFATLRAYVLREVQYGKYATAEEVLEIGDMCTICQEKMSAPIVLHCNHIFCEDCVSEWFERERTCPLCRANIPTAGTRSHSDGTTSLLVQLF